MFVLNSVLLGVGLAMDAVAVSMAEGMQEPKMKSERSLMLPRRTAYRISFR